jgi:hypothetical protein
MLIDCFKYAPTTASEFIFTVDTTQAGSASDTFVLPLHSGTTSMTVYWGDGNSDVITTYNQAELTHVYASSGTYQISLDGAVSGIRFAGAGDRLKILSIDNWGTNQWSTMQFAFYGCSNMVGTYTDSPDTSLVTNMYFSFSGCSSFNSPLTFDCSAVTTMYQMFLGCSSFNSDIEFTNMSNVLDMRNMFYANTVLNSNIILADTSNVTQMSGMFQGCPVFNQPLNLDTSNATSFSSMFLYAGAFDQDISAWNISSLTNAASMFFGSGFSTTNYDLLLVGWQGQTHNNSVAFHAGTAQYSSGAPATARASLITDLWTITDGGQITDTDADAFIAATGITDATQKSAINTLVVDLKSYSLWTKMDAIYPMVGGTATTHKYNLKNPLDTDAAFRLVFSGGWTHSSTGALGNGTNTWANSFLNPYDILSQNNTHLSFYSRTDAIGNQTEIGNNALYLLYRYGSSAYKAFNSSQSIRGSLFTPTTGMLIGSRINSTVEKYYHQGVLTDNLTVNSVAIPPTTNYVKIGSNSSSAQFSAKECAFATIGEGLTDTEANDLETVVQDFQTTLSRNV